MAIGVVILVAVTLTVVVGQNVIPQHEHCDPDSQTNSCLKGDLIDESIADCCYVPWFITGTCDAVHDGWWHRTVNVAKHDRCQSSACDGTYRFACGSPGTNSRCVCDDKPAYDVLGNRCRCQYWPTASPHTAPPHSTTHAPITTTAGPHTTPSHPEKTTPSHPEKTTHPPKNDKNHIIIITVPAVVGGLILIVVLCSIICVCTYKCRGRRGYTALN